ncbi:hypothetical protein CHUAL_002862 [Chamberlinius hualienensis]
MSMEKKAEKLAEDVIEAEEALKDINLNESIAGVADIGEKKLKSEIVVVANEEGVVVGKRLNKKKKKNKKGKSSDDDEDDKEKEKEKGPAPVSFFQLFHYARGVEIFLIIAGIIVAWCQGICMPAMTILFGNMTNAMVDFGGQLNLCFNGTSHNTSIFNHSKFSCDKLKDFLDDHNMSSENIPCQTSDEFHYQIWHYSVGLSVIGAIQVVLGYLMVTCMNIAAEKQVFRIRSLFFQSVLRQDIGWYDTHQTGEFASRTADDLIRFQDGIGEKIGMFNFFLSTFIFSIVNAFVHGWKLTLVILSITPVMMIALGGLGKIQSTFAKTELKAYAKAGSLAEEVLTAVRTVAAFGGEKKEAKNYDSNLGSATKAGINRGFSTAIGAGVLWFMIFAIYALAFWYGVRLIVSDSGYDPSNLVIVFFSVFMGAMNMGQSAPYIEAFSQARAAAAQIYSIIDRVPPIDSSSDAGNKLDKVDGNFEFNNIFFKYPSRPDVPILNGLSLKVKNGETVALVGESGCGKSTTVQLIQRFYDPHEGSVTLDGHDIRTLNIGWLRDRIGIVGQEPILFGTTIAENIKYGMDSATHEDIVNAAKMANAHNFIMKLPKKYETLVGDRGAQLSGGQKQRVAIARALIKNPKILLLDEATSALDSESEAVVQAALDKARLGRTTLIIAHRLSTIRNADKIAAIQGGKVVELGTHDELMAIGGIYHTLVTTQTSDKDENLKSDAKETGDDSLRQLERSISEMTENSVNEVVEGASSLAYTPSFRRRKHLTSTTSVGSTKEETVPTELHPSLRKVLSYNRDEWGWIALGCLGALGMGLSMPAYAILFGDVMGALAICDDDLKMQRTTFYACMFLVIGVCAGLASFFQIFSFTYAGECLTRRLRQLSFRAMLKQEMAFFDDQKNSVGALCTRLSADAASVQGATGSRIGTIIQSFCTLGAACVVSLVYCWQLALLAMCFIPVILIARYMHATIIRKQTLVEMDSFDSANKVAIESITNIRTVASLHKEKKFHEIYINHLIGPHRKAILESHLRGLIFGAAQSTTFFTYAAIMYYGGYLVQNQRIEYEVMFKVSQLVIMGSSMVASAFAFAPNYSKGIVSAARIFVLLERKPIIDSSLESGLKLPDSTPGVVRFKGVEFRYPARKDIPVLQGLNLDINPGHVVALVGSSGCGKSTCIQLLERFYDPLGGEVTMDGTNISQLNIGWLRSRIGIVSQEPILFDRSIAQNIAYGDNNREVPMDEIIQAAKNANIHNFITALPEGYETSVGDKGTQLSGGQKQRIAIARALVRNPKILLLDEATSALDTESEKVVQEALEQAQKGRTCITVAHRLSTIKDANQIAVIHHGKVVELGTHDELMAQHGHYFRFYQTQAKGRS